VLPVVAVQIAPAESAPALEGHLLGACNAGLSRARCVSALSAVEPARAIAVVSWNGTEHVSIEVGLAGEGAGEPVWLSRELDFAVGDPEAERWRAVGFTIALLADDPQFWPRPEPPPPADSVTAEPASPAEIEPEPRAAALELRGLTGTGLTSGPWRWGAELRLALPLSGIFFLSSSVDYALANGTGLEVRWFDATLGAGAYAALMPDLEGRVRLELLVENVAVTVQQGTLTDSQAAWVPGVALGADLGWSIADPWLLSARADVFWVDGSTVIEGGGRRLGESAGAGVLLGMGAGYRF
jgi:hypothetical protein